MTSIVSIRTVFLFFHCRLYTLTNHMLSAPFFSPKLLTTFQLYRCFCEHHFFLCYCSCFPIPIILVFGVRDELDHVGRVDREWENPRNTIFYMNKKKNDKKIETYSCLFNCFPLFALLKTAWLEGRERKKETVSKVTGVVTYRGLYFFMCHPDSQCQ